MKHEKPTCFHADCYVVGFFVDNFAKETFLIQECGNCGKVFFLMGKIPEMA